MVLGYVTAHCHHRLTHVHVMGPRVGVFLHLCIDDEFDGFWCEHSELTWCRSNRNYHEPPADTGPLRSGPLSICVSSLHEVVLQEVTELVPVLMSLY